MKKERIGAIEAAYCFVRKDGQRPNLAEPWLKCGRIWATDGHILFSTPWVCVGDVEGKAVLLDGRPVSPRGVLPDVEQTKVKGEALADHAPLMGMLSLPGPSTVEPGLFFVDVATLQIGAIDSKATPNHESTRPTFDLAYMSLAVRTLRDMWLAVDRVVVAADLGMVEVCAGETKVIVAGVRL
jgi:hypothetical protein